MKYAFYTLAAALFLASQSFGAVKYWDINGVTAGSGVVAASTTNWGTNNWSTDSTGSTATISFTSGTDTAIFAAGTDGGVAYTVNLSSALTSSAVTVEEGTITKTGAALTVQNITVNNGAGFFINAASALTVAAGGSLVLNGGTIGNSNTGSGGSFLGTGTANTNMPITLNGGGHVSANGGAGIVTIETGLIQGTGPLVVDGSGAFRLTTTTATYSGATNINGTLQISTTANVLPAGTDMTINSGGKFDQQASQSINSLSGAGTLAFTNSATVLTVSGSNDTSFTGAVTGAGTLTKTGGSTITIGSDWANTGPTNINAGTIKFGTSAAGLSTSSAVTIASGATLDMNNINDSMGTIAGGGGITNNSGTTGLTIVGTGSTAFSGSISGTSSFTKSSASTGTTTLSGNNTVKNLNINAGIFTITGSNTISGAVNIAGNGTLSASSGRINFNNNNAAGAADVFVTGNGAEISNSAAGITTANTIHLDGGAPTGITDAKLVQIESTSGNSWNITGKITGTGGVLRDNDGAGTLTLSGANDFTGGFFISNREVTAGSKDAFGTGTLTIGSSTMPTTAISLKSASNLSSANAIANAVNVNQDFGVAGTQKLELSGNVNLGAVNRTVTVTNTADTIVSGVIGDGDLGTGALSKAGAGKLVLSGPNVYGGGTVVTAGTLLANNTSGSATGIGNVGVSGGVFGGTGSITGSVTVSGTGILAPGASVGALNIGALSLLAGSTLLYEIDSTTGINLTVAADLVNANGSLAIASTAALTLADVAVTPGSVPVGSKFTLISYSGPWDGDTFASAPDNSVLPLGGNYFYINYDDTTGGSNFLGGTGNTFVTLTAVPEANAFWLGGAICLVLGLTIGTRKMIANRVAV